MCEVYDPVQEICISRITCDAVVGVQSLELLNSAVPLELHCCSGCGFKRPNGIFVSSKR